MSYLVLARKWRPQSFDELIGQEPIIRVLKNSIDQNRIAHAYLFSGPRGVGKTSTARILAKALNCQEGASSSPCGRCAFCTSITDGSSVDVMEIDGASNNSVNDIRDLRERVKYVPSGAQYKVYIIDETHMLSDAAFNALLKTLEEPPSHVIFVLATTSPRKIPATVLSRCQHLMFRRIPTPQIRDRLKQISSSEEISIARSALDMIARAADGSLRDALTILDQISSFSSDVTESDIHDLLGITDFNLLSTLSRALIDGRREDLISIAGDLAERGTDIRSFMRDLIQFFRDLLVLSVTKKHDELLELSSEERAAMKEIIKKTSEDHLTLMISELLKAEVDVRNASLPRLVFEMYLLKISFLSDMQPIQEIMEKLDAYARLHPDSPGKSNVQELHDLPGRGTHRSTPPESIPQKNDHAGNERELQEVNLTDEIWEKILAKVNPPLSSKLSKASYKLEGSTVALAFDEGHSVFQDSINKNAEYLAGILSKELGTKVQVRVTMLRKGKIPKKKDLKEEVLSDPMVKEVLELFDGRIVDVNPIPGKKAADAQ